MMNVLYTVHYPVFGGPHNQAQILNRPLLKQGWHTVVLLPDERGNAAQRLREAGLDVVQLPLHRLRARLDPRLLLRFALSFPSDIRGIRRLIRERQIDVAVVNGLVNPHAAIAARLEGVPVVWRLIDTRLPMPLRHVLMPFVTGLADVVMTTGAEIARVHPGARGIGKRLVVFYPAVDMDLFQPDPAVRQRSRAQLGLTGEDLVVGNVSNINPQKGHATFIRAAAALRRLQPTVRFVILGATYENHAAYAASLWRLAQSLGLTLGRDLIVRNPGSAVPELAQAFDVFWLTSEPLSEGLPTVVPEAMALEVPVVTVDVGAVREVVQDGSTGFVVAPGDIDAMASLTDRLLRSQDLRRRLGRAGRLDADRRHGLEICAKTDMYAFELAIANRRRRTGEGIAV